jgi:hypothetical protein
MDTTVKKRGGTREGAGRKPLTQEQKDEKQRIFETELIFPAVCQAFHADPGPFKERYLSVTLSRLDIRKAYGDAGLESWMTFFKQEKIGGCDRFGVGYKTRWSLNFSVYPIAKMLVESLGHTIKDLPNPGFPPDAMIERLKKLEEKKIQRRIKNKSTL